MFEVWKTSVCSSSSSSSSSSGRKKEARCINCLHKLSFAHLTTTTTTTKTTTTNRFGDVRQIQRHQARCVSKLCDNQLNTIDDEDDDENASLRHLRTTPSFPYRRPNIVCSQRYSGDLDFDNNNGISVDIHCRLMSPPPRTSLLIEQSASVQKNLIAAATTAAYRTPSTTKATLRHRSWMSSSISCRSIHSFRKTIVLLVALSTIATCQQPPQSHTPSQPSQPPQLQQQQQQQSHPQPLPQPQRHMQERLKTLYIAGFLPTSTDIPQGSIGRGVLPAVKLALQHVNESPLFTKYKLDLVWNDTKCDAAWGMQAFFRMLDEEPVKIILFGDACPAVTDPIAKASKFFHLLQLSYADTFTAITANFFRIVPSEGSFNPARVKLLKFFNWTKVGTIFQNSPRYSLPHSKLLTDLDNAGIDIVASQSLADDLRPGMYFPKFKEKDVRIILGNFGEKWGRRIFCEAFKEGIYGRRYQWIITGIYDNNWWQLSDEESLALDCTEEQLLAAIDGYISTDVLTLSKNSDTHYGFESSLYKSEYDRVRLKEYSRFHGYAYDGIWAIAFAIQAVDKKLRMRNSHLAIDDFQYRDPFWAQLFREALNETHFDGVTGHVSFDKNERRGIVLLQQFQSKQLSPNDIAQYYTSNDELIFESNHIDWRGGIGPPVDRNTVVISPSRISITLFIVISVFAIIGIVIAFVFLAMNIKYRNQRYIKMSSPYLNNLIIIGCILTYTSVILLGLNSGLTSESNFPYICASRAWVLMTGFTLAFGSMFSKTWRVHAIFTDIKLNKKLIKDYKLFMVVGILVFIDVATLTTWQIVDPFYRATSQGKPEPSPQNEDILVIPEMEYCQSKRMTVFLGSIYMYKGVLMAIGIFLAWETRQVSIPALNDSKYIGMSVYNVVIMCVIGAGLSFVLRDQQDAAFVIISIFIIFCSTATLCLVFVPKLIELKRNPNAGDRRVRATLKPFKKLHRDSEEVEIHTKIKLMTEDNFRFRQRLKEKSYELEALTFRLRALEESMKQIKSNEVLVEENDLKQLDNCDQRKLSVSTNLKAPNVPPLPSSTTMATVVAAGVNSRRRKSSSTTRSAVIGKIELLEEISSPEIIVNSTSLFSLSSEAAQLTVKNGCAHDYDIEVVGGGGDSNHSSHRSSKSSDEAIITYRTSERRKDSFAADHIDVCDVHKTSHHDQHQQHRNHAGAHQNHYHHHHRHRHHQHHPDTLQANDSIDQNSVDSDDTSYAKAISQSAASSSQSTTQSIDGICGLVDATDDAVHLCHSHRTHALCHPTVHHTCCHHHLEHHHHHHHHPHHLQQEQCLTTTMTTSMMTTTTTVTIAETVNTISSSTIIDDDDDDDRKKYFAKSNKLLRNSESVTSAIEYRCEQIDKPSLSAAINEPPEDAINAVSGGEKSFSNTRTRRSQSFGGFLQRQQNELSTFRWLVPPGGVATTTTSLSSSTACGGGVIRHTSSTSPVRTCVCVDDPLNLPDQRVGHHRHACSNVNSNGNDNSAITSAASYVRLFPYLNRSATIDQNQPLRSGQSCPQVRCDIVEYL